jgi:hypothetical protein
MMWGKLVSLIISAFGGAVGAWAGRVLLRLGIGFVTYKGIDVSLGYVKNQLVTTLSGMPADMVGLMGFLWVDKALSVIFSGFVVALSTKLVGGSVKKMVFK